MSRGDIAKNYFLNGYNCSQSVVLAFSDMTGLTSDSLAMLAQPFGGGMGGMREVCGTVSGMWIVLGALFGDSQPKNPKKRNELYARVRELAQRFEYDNGSLICRELLGLTPLGSSKGLVGDKPIVTNKNKRPCPELCKYVGDLLEEYIDEHQSEIVNSK